MMCGSARADRNASRSTRAIRIALRMTVYLMLLLATIATAGMVVLSCCNDNADTTQIVAGFLPFMVFPISPYLFLGWLNLRAKRTAQAITVLIGAAVIGCAGVVCIYDRFYHSVIEEPYLWLLFGSVYQWIGCTIIAVVCSWLRKKPDRSMKEEETLQETRSSLVRSGVLQILYMVAGIVILAGIYATLAVISGEGSGRGLLQPSLYESLEKAYALEGSYPSPEDVRNYIGGWLPTLCDDENLSFSYVLCAPDEYVLIVSPRRQSKWPFRNRWITDRVYLLKPNGIYRVDARAAASLPVLKEDGIMAWRHIYDARTRARPRDR